MSQPRKTIRNIIMTVGTGLAVTCLISSCSAPSQPTSPDDGTKVTSDSTTSDSQHDLSDDTKAVSDSTASDSEYSLPVVMDAQEVGTQGIIMGRFKTGRETTLVMKDGLESGYMGVMIKDVESQEVSWEGKTDAQEHGDQEFTVGPGDYYVVALGYDKEAKGTVTIDFANSDSQYSLPVVMGAHEVAGSGVIMGRFKTDKETALIMKNEMESGYLNVMLKDVKSREDVWEGKADAQEHGDQEFTVEPGDYYVVAFGHDKEAKGTVTIDFAN